MWLKIMKKTVLGLTWHKHDPVAIRDGAGNMVQ